MIEPIKTNITNGINKALVKIEENGFEVKFDKSTPEFTKQVSQIVDNFTFNDKVDKTQNGLQQLVQDVFERSNNVVK